MSQVDWQEVFDGPERAFNEDEKDAVFKSVGPCKVYHPDAYDKIMSSSIEDYMYSMDESLKSLADEIADFHREFYANNFQRAKVAHDYIRDWRPE